MITAVIPLGAFVPNEEQDRTEWENVWSKMQHRKLETWDDVALSKILTDEWSRFEFMTIAVTETPRQFVHRVLRNSIACPVCGADVVSVDGIPISIYPSSKIADKQLTVGFGAWMHPACFSRCPQSNEPTPVPW